jgi:hypothetical protein
MFKLYTINYQQRRSCWKAFFGQHSYFNLYVGQTMQWLNFATCLCNWNVLHVRLLHVSAKCTFCCFLISFWALTAWLMFSLPNSPQNFGLFIEIHKPNVFKVTDLIVNYLSFPGSKVKCYVISSWYKKIKQDNVVTVA